VIMTPKSLLRHPKVISPMADLAQGHFLEVLDDTLDREPVERILLCSGKVYYDLLAQRESSGRTDTAVIRIEQFYPFPEQALGECLDGYPHVRQVTWVQEEPRNAGAWAYLRERFTPYVPALELHYFGREESPSSGTGSFHQYQRHQKELMERVFESMPVSTEVER
jgi:2-oxoglutarate dehydrogenase E1 component